MTDIELVFDFELKPFERDEKEDEDLFDFTIPEFDLNPTDYSFETLIIYFGVMFGWQSIMLLD